MKLSGKTILIAVVVGVVVAIVAGIMVVVCLSGGAKPSGRTPAQAAVGGDRSAGTVPKAAPQQSAERFVVLNAGHRISDESASPVATDIPPALCYATDLSVVADGYNAAMGLVGITIHVTNTSDAPCSIPHARPTVTISNNGSDLHVRNVVSDDSLLSIDETATAKAFQDDGQLIVLDAHDTVSVGICWRRSEGSFETRNALELHIPYIGSMAAPDKDEGGFTDRFDEQNAVGISSWQNDRDDADDLTVANVSAQSIRESNKTPLADLDECTSDDLAYYVDVASVWGNQTIISGTLLNIGANQCKVGHKIALSSADAPGKPVTELVVGGDGVELPERDDALRISPGRGLRFSTLCGETGSSRAQQWLSKHGKAVSAAPTYLLPLDDVPTCAAP